MHRARTVAAAVAAVLIALAPAAQAGSIEEAFRAFVERLKAQGQRFEAWVPAVVRVKPALVKRSDKLPLGRTEYAVFVAPGCSECRRVVQELRRRGLAFEELDVVRNAAARDALSLVGLRQVPVTLVGRYALVGWSDALWDQALTRDVQDSTEEAKGQGS